MLPFDIQSYWEIFPIGICIASVAVCTGIDGAAFWGPVLLLGYKVEPSVAVACGIFIQMFGFGSGVYGYAKRKAIVFSVARPLIFFTVPFSLLGAYVSKILPNEILTACMGAGCFLLALRNFQEARHGPPDQLSVGLPLKHRPLGYFLNSMGGFFTGALGFGIGEINNYFLLLKNRYPIAYSSGTTVFIVAVTAAATSVFNIFFYRHSAPADITTFSNVVVFAVPAVIIGGQIGVRLAHNARRRGLHALLAFAFMLIAVLSIMKTLK